MPRLSNSRSEIRGAQGKRRGQGSVGRASWASCQEDTAQKQPPAGEKFTGSRKDHTRAWDCQKGTLYPPQKAEPVEWLWRLRTAGWGGRGRLAAWWAGPHQRAPSREGQGLRHHGSFGGRNFRGRGAHKKIQPGTVPWKEHGIWEPRETQCKHETAARAQVPAPLGGPLGAHSPEVSFTRDSSVLQCCRVCGLLLKEKHMQVPREN